MQNKIKEKEDMQMDNQKIENQLNLAIEATPQEREKSMDLEVGFNSEQETWQVIVKFYGTEQELKDVFAEVFPNQYNSIKIQDLIGKYAILEVPQNLVEQVAALPEIEYMEKPKRLFFTVNNDTGIFKSNLVPVINTCSIFDKYSINLT